jgi:hypothetical protein
MVSTVSDTIWLEWMAQLMGEPTPKVRPPLDRSDFYCLLDEQPTHLVPMRYVPRRYESGGQDSTSVELICNPFACVCWDGELPGGLRQRPDLVARFALQGPVVWVADPATDALQPFWLGPEFEELLADFRPGEPMSRDLPAATQATLAGAGILVARDHVARRRKRWAETAAHCSRLFRKGYTPIAGLIHPYHLGALRRYVRHLIRNKQVDLGDGQSPLRYGIHNEGALHFFHHQLTSALSDIAGEMLKPSYAYTASYLAGSELAKHTDRLQCEFTISLCLDFAPEPELETPWPLHLETPEGSATVFQGIGDALFFRGRQVPHYRKRFERGTTSTSVFFHYVSKGFEGKLD